MPTSTIQDLPVEVLLKVFDAFLGPKAGQRGGVDDLQRRRRPAVLTHICQDWRRKALGHPFLWTDVQIHGKSELYLSFFERSHPLPVDVTIRASSQRLFARTAIAVRDRFIFLEEETAKRIASIWTHGVGPSDIAYILSPLNRTRLSNLKSLCLRKWQMEPDMDHANHWTFLTNAKSITSVTLANICIDCAPKPKAVTKLELLTIPVGFNAAVFSGIIESFPALEMLVLGDVDMSTEFHSVAGNTAMTPAQPIINAPNLKTLVVTPQAVYCSMLWSGINVAQPCTSECQCSLRSLGAENLEYLEISGSKGGAAVVHLLSVIYRRVKNEDAPPLRLMLNGIDHRELEQIHQLPQTLYLHIGPSSFEPPEAYDFIHDYLGAVLYFQNHQGVLMGLFKESGKYHRSKQSNLALTTSKSKEDAIEPLLDSLRIERRLEDDGEYENYWREGSDTLGHGSGRSLTHRMGHSSAGLLDDYDSDGTEIQVHPYGWEEDEYYDEYEEGGDWEGDEWEDHPDEYTLEDYAEDPGMIGESGGAEGDDDNLGDIGPTGVERDAEGGFGDYGEAESVYDPEDYFNPEDHLQTGVIYYGEGEVALDTGVLDLVEELYLDYDHELSDNPWADDSEAPYVGEALGDAGDVHGEEDVGDYISSDEQAAEAEYYDLDEGEGGAAEGADYYDLEEGESVAGNDCYDLDEGDEVVTTLDSEGVEEGHGPVWDEGSEIAGGGGYDSGPDTSDFQSEEFYDSPDFDDGFEGGGYDDGDLYDDDWF